MQVTPGAPEYYLHPTPPQTLVMSETVRTPCAVIQPPMLPLHPLSRFELNASTVTAVTEASDARLRLVRSGGMPSPHCNPPTHL